MRKYRYTGDITVIIPQIGKVAPGQSINSKVEINHPSFEEVKAKKIVAKQKGVK